jgi:hypothetical protein
MIVSWVSNPIPPRGRLGVGGGFIFAKFLTVANVIVASLAAQFEKCESALREAQVKMTKLAGKNEGKQPQKQVLRPFDCPQGEG